MSDYKKKMGITEALQTMDTMLETRRKDTRAKSADVIETVLYAYEQLKHDNKCLQNRCYALTSGKICMWCPLECERRTMEFQEGGKNEI